MAAAIACAPDTKTRVLLLDKCQKRQEELIQFRELEDISKQYLLMEKVKNKFKQKLE